MLTKIRLICALGVLITGLTVTSNSYSGCNCICTSPNSVQQVAAHDTPDLDACKAVCPEDAFCKE